MDARGMKALSAARPVDRPTDEPKYFTLDEANRTLPLVRRIVGDIVESYARFQDRLKAFHQLAAEMVPIDRERTEALREEIDDLAEEINGFLGELRQIGCEFKGFDEGLVDFLSLRDGRPVFLCWKLGEESIEHWHELDAGFAGRQPLAPPGIG